MTAHHIIRSQLIKTLSGNSLATIIHCAHGTVFLPLHPRPVRLRCRCVPRRLAAVGSNPSSTTMCRHSRCEWIQKRRVGNGWDRKWMMPTKLDQRYLEPVEVAEGSWAEPNGCLELTEHIHRKTRQKDSLPISRIGGMGISNTAADWLLILLANIPPPFMV